MLYTKEFLDQLQEKCKEIDILEYLMKAQNRTFPDCILEISKFFGLEPQYIHRERSKREDLKNWCEICDQKTFENEEGICEFCAAEV